MTAPTFRDRVAAGVAATVRRQTRERTRADLKAQLAEQRHQVRDLDADSAVRLPGCIPMCPPKSEESPS